MWKDSGPTMDNSTYVPNHLQPPSLVVFSQAGGLPDALRMQRPFNPQVTDSKDLHVPFSTAASLGYGLHHMLHLPHQFLHPLDPRLPFGAFRPLGPSAFAPPSKCLKVETGNASVSSGLASISSLSGMSNMFSPSLPSSGGVAGGLSAPGQDTAPQSPAGSASRSPLGNAPGSTTASNRGPSPDEEDRDANATPGSENTERSTPEEGRPYRLGPMFGGRCGAEALGLGLGLSLGPAYRFALPPGLAAKSTRCLVFDQGKKKFPADPSCCPVCSVTVRPQELEQHFAQELDRLYKVSATNSRPRPRSILPVVQDHPHGQILHTPSTADGTPQGRWETYKRIRANRQARIRVKNRKRKADEPACPVCNERLSGTPEELTQHVERCLNKHNGGNGSNVNLDDEEVDVEGDTETFEEYEWAGQKRIRATSMLVGGFSAAGLATSSRSGNGAGNPGRPEEEEDLIVDGDETAQFGPAQYSEADVIAPRGEGTPREQKERDALREAVISPNAPLTPHTPPDQPHGAQVEVKPEPGTIIGLNNPASPSSTPSRQRCEGEEGVTVTPGQDGNDTPVVDALRSRIRELENEMRGQPFKCLICMEQYKKPVTSVCCWHVHCEQCWLHTLGAKKLCPQCNMITSPADLRRIYM
ncbi:E3 ubiquitin-protein ligase Rnf220-like isoform X1 [Diachasmimorpha longicaudata]|uniref:E3 ubiquitin-protein ligase Rnf220-like isoform X1 n=3 Tax=Diachasmimorpha longicaudata TaxID=58733 RepID=UPI0030B87BC9